MTPKTNKDFDWLTRTIRTKVQAGTLQEEPILAALEDRLVHGTPLLREASSICILFALVLTFYRLHDKLPGIFDKQGVRSDMLPVLLTLVGANWWLILAGLIFHLLSIVERSVSLWRFDIYREWLERDIFPYTGVAKTIADHLAGSLKSFGGTVAGLQESLLPLRGLASVMQGFQEGMVNELVPAFSKGLEGVKIGLSDDALNQLRKTTVESTRALQDMKDQQAKMLALTISAERRTVELAAAVQSIVEQTSRATTTLENQIVALENNGGLIDSLRAAVTECTTGSRSLVTSMRGVMDSTASHIEQLNDHTRVLVPVTQLLPEVSKTLTEMQQLMPGIQLGLAALAVSENSLRTEMEQSRVAVTEASSGLASSLSNAAALKVLWEEAMLQMTSLTDEVSRRTNGFEKSTADLTSVASVVAARLPDIENALNSVGTKVGTMSTAASEIAEGNKAVVSAFGDLQSASQKLKNLGHAITGHFNVWQEQTRKVYGKAQESTESIEASFTRMGQVVSGMETTMRSLSEGITRVEAVQKHLTESTIERLPTDEQNYTPAVGNGLASTSAIADEYDPAVEPVV